MKKSSFSLSLRLTVTLSLFVAISIVFGKYLAINVGEVLRFSFENLTIIFAGIAFGAIPGMLVGVVADLVGCVLVGYTVNPLVTLGALAIGAVSGITFKLTHKLSTLPRVTISASVSHLIGSVIIKTFGLAIYYDMPIHILMLWRLLNYSIIVAVEVFFISVLIGNKSIQNQIHKLGGNLK